MLQTERHSGDACVKVSGPQVLHESIDGEVIVINLTTGTYYSLRGSAADVWELIQRPVGVGVAAISDMLATRFAVSRAEAEAALDPFLADLRAEELVFWENECSGPAPEAGNAGSNGHDGARLAFIAPTLEKFTDMQALVLLDPVHEVAETGWPQQPDAAGGIPTP